MVFVFAIVLMSAFRPNLAQTQPTNHATAETANCIAQGPRFGGGYCPVATPSPTHSPISLPIQALPLTATATPELIEPTVTPTPEPPCWLTDQDTGDPSAGFIVFDENGNPIPCPVVIDNPEPEPDVVIPTETPVPVPTRTSLSQAAQTTPTPQIVYVPATPQIVTVVITASPIPTTSITPTVTRTPTMTITPTPTPTSTQTLVPTATPTLEPTATLVPLVATDVQLETQSRSGWLSGPMGIALIVASVIGGPALIIFGLHFWNSR